MKTRIHIALLLLTLLAFAACRRVPTYEVGTPKGDTLKENMINANRIIAQSEEQQIDAYLARRGWPTKRLQGGVRVSEMGTGGTLQNSPIAYEDTVDIVYSVLTLGGDTIYSHREESVVAGHLKPTRGLDAALRSLHDGEQAMVVVPSEQAYGVVGDGDRVRTRTVLVYDVEIKSVKKLSN